jgi:hypothetical protein
VRLVLAPSGAAARGAWAAARARPAAMKLWGWRLGFLGSNEGMATGELRAVEVEAGAGKLWASKRGRGRGGRWTWPVAVLGSVCVGWDGEESGAFFYFLVNF